MRNALAVFLAALTGSGLSTQAPQPAATGLDAGIQQVKDGHFDAALLTLDAVVRQLRSDPARHPELTRAFVYLGAAYVGLQQESPARENFKEALKLDKALQLDPNEFPPRVVRVFEATRKGKSKSAMYAGGGIGLLGIGAGALALLGSAGGLAATELGGVSRSLPLTSSGPLGILSLVSTTPGPDATITGCRNGATCALAMAFTLSNTVAIAGGTNVAVNVTFGNRVCLRGSAGPFGGVASGQSVPINIPSFRSECDPPFNSTNVDVEFLPPSGSSTRYVFTVLYNFAP